MQITKKKKYFRSKFQRRILLKVLFQNQEFTSKSVPAVLLKKKMIIMRPFFGNFKLCKIAPKFAIIMQTVQKY